MKSVVENIIAKLVSALYSISLLFYTMYFFDADTYKRFNLFYVSALIISSFLFNPLIVLKSRYYFDSQFKEEVYLYNLKLKNRITKVLLYLALFICIFLVVFGSKDYMFILILFAWILVNNIVNEFNQNCILVKDFNRLVVRHVIRVLLLLSVLSIFIFFNFHDYVVLSILVICLNLIFFNKFRITGPINLNKNAIRNFDRFLFPVYVTMGLNLLSDYFDRYIIASHLNADTYMKFYKFYDLQVLIVGSALGVLYSLFFSDLQRAYTSNRESIDYKSRVTDYLQVLILTSLILMFNFYFLHHEEWTRVLFSVDEVHLISGLFLVLWTFKLLFFDTLLLFEDKSKFIMVVLLSIIIFNLIGLLLWIENLVILDIFLVKFLGIIVGLLLTLFGLEHEFLVKVDLSFLIWCASIALLLEFDYFGWIPNNELVLFGDYSLFILVNIVFIFKFRKYFNLWSHARIN